MKKPASFLKKKDIFLWARGARLFIDQPRVFATLFPGLFSAGSSPLSAEKSPGNGVGTSDLKILTRSLEGWKGRSKFDFKPSHDTKF